MQTYILDDSRTPVPVDDFEVWGRWYETTSNRVAADTLGDVKVSTVFLGINHAWNHGPLLLFETMIFGGSLDGQQERYSTWAEAEAGHAAIVERVKQAEDAEPSKG